jgi:phosphohistidine phosphatase
MRTLLVMRHGKSDWDQTGLPDHDRPLAKRGKRESVSTGETLLEMGMAPQTILSSTARRAVSTAKRVAKASEASCPVETHRALYGGDVRDYCRAVAGVDDDAQIVMVVGHNPVSEELVAELCGQGVHLATATIACIELPIQSWHDLKPHTRGRLRAVWAPSKEEDAESD